MQGLSWLLWQDRYLFSFFFLRCSLSYREMHMASSSGYERVACAENFSMLAVLIAKCWCTYAVDMCIIYVDNIDIDGAHENMALS